MFFVFTLLTPAAIVNKIVFIMLIYLLIAMVGPNLLFRRVCTFSPLVVFFIFLYGYLASLAGNTDKALSNQFMVAVSLLFIIYLIEWYDIDIDYIVKFSGVLLSLLTALLYFLLLQPTLLFSGLFDLFSTYSLGSFGQREFSENSTAFFHLGTAPFLFLPFSLFCVSLRDRKSFGNAAGAVLTGLAIIASFSRGVIILSFASMLLIMWSNFTKKWKLISVLLLFPILAGVLYYFSVNTQVFSSEEISNKVKMGHVLSYFDSLTLKNFFFGDGLASYYYSSGTELFMAHTEVTPIDMCRYFGVFLTFSIFAVLVFPTLDFRRYQGENFLYFILFLLYLLLSATNPTLINSFGLLVVVWYWSKILSRRLHSRYKPHRCIGGSEIERI